MTRKSLNVLNKKVLNKIKMKTKESDRRKSNKTVIYHFIRRILDDTKKFSS